MQMLTIHVLKQHAKMAEDVKHINCLINNAFMRKASMANTAKSTKDQQLKLQPQPKPLQQPQPQRQQKKSYGKF